MSGFPGQHGYGEFMAGQRERDREAARHDVPPVERSVELHDITDALRMRIDILSRTKVDKMTTRDLEKTVRCLEEALRVIARMTDEIEQLRHKARKAGTSEGK
jgi:hypothetical protein